MSSRQLAYWLSTSSSVASPSLKKSFITVTSSIAEFILSKAVVQLFNCAMLFSRSSAFLGSSHRPGRCDRLSFSAILSSLPWMSKIPP